MAYKQNSPLPILQGGTNTQSFGHVFGVAYYDGGALNNIDPGTSGYILTSNGTSAPSFQVASGGSGIVTINGDSGSITGTTVSIVGAGGITTSGSGTTLTLTGSSSGITWNNVTSSTQALAINNGYISNDGATLITMTLPSTAAIGSVIQIQGAGSGLFTVAQNASQVIHFNEVATTTGTGGSISSTSQFDSLTLICVTANTTWAVNQSQGNLSVV